jgi:hypothetical protein
VKGKRKSSTLGLQRQLKATCGQDVQFSAMGNKMALPVEGLTFDEIFLMKN